MGIMDNLGDLAKQHEDRIEQGIEQVGNTIDDKTGGKYTDKIDTGVEKAKDALDGLDGKNDDIR